MAALPSEKIYLGLALLVAAGSAAGFGTLVLRQERAEAGRGAGGDQQGESEVDLFAGEGGHAVGIPGSGIGRFGAALGGQRGQELDVFDRDGEAGG